MLRRALEIEQEQALGRDSPLSDQRHVAVTWPSRASIAGKPIIQAFDRVIQRELAGEAEVREEIKQRRTYWAASEIYKFRRQVKAATQSVTRQPAGSPAGRGLLSVFDRRRKDELVLNDLIAGFFGHPDQFPCFVVCIRSRCRPHALPRFQIEEKFPLAVSN